MAGRPKKKNVNRERNGRAQRGEYHPETIARRERELEAAGIIAFPERKVEGRTIKATATDALAGSTIGKLLLRWRQDKSRPDCISQDQYDAADQWLKLCHRHAAIMGYKINIGAASLEIGGGISTAAEPDEEYIARTRRRWRACHEALGKEGGRVWAVTSGVVLEEWPIERMTQSEVGQLRIGLNAVRRALDRS